MNLDQELRATLSSEAGMRAAPTPDVHSLIRGGRARRRRRNLARVGGGAAALLIGTSVYGVTQLDWSSDPAGTVTATQPPEPAPAPPPLPSDDDHPELAPGATYRVLVGRDAAGAVIEADLTVEGPDWLGGDFAVVSDSDGEAFAGFGVYQPLALAAGAGCGGLDGPVTSDVPDTPRALAGKLAGLPRSTVVQAPAPAEAFGYDAVHLRLRIDVDCPGNYRLAVTANGGRGITYPGKGGVITDVLVDFWVFDLGAAPVVVDQWHNSDAPAALVERVAQARESISFVTGE